MGKRSDFKRVERDYYKTPLSAVLPLLPHLKPNTHYVEPCAGDGALVDHLASAGHKCVKAYDIEPQRSWVDRADALTHSMVNTDCFITNPPWSRKVLHPLIAHLASQHPAWLLFDADWAHTIQAAPYMPLLRKIVSIGRVKWIPGSPHTGKDNCAWHLFDARSEGPAVFFGRTV